MLRIDKVRKALADKGEGVWVTAGDLAAELGLTRANVSFDLNRLCEEGRAQKRGGRPVYYSAMQAAAPKQQPHADTRSDSSFDAFLLTHPRLFSSG